MRKLWSEPELDYLLSLTEKYDRATSISRFQDEARRRGWPPRSFKAISKQLWVQGISNVDGPFYSLRQVSMILGVCIIRVQRWVRLRLIKTKPRSRKTNSPCYIHGHRIKGFLLSHPEELVGVSRDGLAYFLGSYKAADALLEKIPKTSPRFSRHRITIKNSNGQTFPSQVEAAKHSNYSLSGFRYMLDKGGIDYQGVRWWRVRKNK